MRKQYHTRTVGADTYTWNVHWLVRLAKFQTPVSVPLSNILELDEIWWFQKDEVDKPTPRSLAEHMALVRDTDLKYPIILCDKGRLMDGMHRVVKALLEGKDTILAAHTLPPDWSNTMQEGLILGFMDGIACWVRENRRPAEKRSSFLVQVEHDRSERCLVRLEREAEAGQLGDFPMYRFIALAVGLDLMEFHKFHMHWRRSHPELASWFEMQVDRQSMRETVPV